MAVQVNPAPSQQSSVLAGSYIPIPKVVLFIEQFLKIVDKQAQLVPLKLNTPQKIIAEDWANRMIVCKSRQQGSSTFELAVFFTEALFIPGLTVAVISHEEYATTRLLGKVDTFYNNLPADLRAGNTLTRNSKYEMQLSNGSTIYIGTAGSRAFGRGDTIHRCLVSEEAHYVDSGKLLSGLQEAVPMTGYIVRESTPAGDSGVYYDTIQDCIEGKSDYKLIPLYWWLSEEYQIPRGSELVIEQERGDLEYSKAELELVLRKNLTEDQIRWMRWKIRNMKQAEKAGTDSNKFPQEYISDLETCFLGEQNRVMMEIDDQLTAMSLGCKDAKRDGYLEIWRPPELGQRYVVWCDPCGGESVSNNDPHDGVVLRIHPGGLEQVAAFCTTLDQKAQAYLCAEVASKYNNAMLVVERNGVGKGVLNYLVMDIRYPKLYMEIGPTGEITGKYGWFTTKENKSHMIAETIQAFKNDRVVTYDRKVIRQLRALVNVNTKTGYKVEAKKPARDDRAMAFMGAISISLVSSFSSHLAVGDYVNFRR